MEMRATLAFNWASSIFSIPYDARELFVRFIEPSIDIRMQRRARIREIQYEWDPKIVKSVLGYNWASYVDVEREILVDMFIGHISQGDRDRYGLIFGAITISDVNIDGTLEGRLAMLVSPLRKMNWRVTENEARRLLNKLSIMLTMLYALFLSLIGQIEDESKLRNSIFHAVHRFSNNLRQELGIENEILFYLSDLTAVYRSKPTLWFFL